MKKIFNGKDGTMINEGVSLCEEIKIGNPPLSFRHYNMYEKL